MNKQRFLEIFNQTKFKMKPEHVNVLFNLIKDKNEADVSNALFEINKTHDAFPKREILFNIIERYKIKREDIEVTPEDAHDDKSTLAIFSWYRVTRHREPKFNSFSINPSFWKKYGKKNA